MTGARRASSVLFVDGEQPIRDLFGRALGAAGLDFEGAADGDQALAALDRRSYDAIVVDIIAPDREGVETIVQIRKRWPESFIIAVSGGGRMGAQDFLHLAVMVGADRTLAKPFTPAQLLALITYGPPPSVAA